MKSDRQNLKDISRKVTCMRPTEFQLRFHCGAAFSLTCTGCLLAEIIFFSEKLLTAINDISPLAIAGNYSRLISRATLIRINNSATCVAYQSLYINQFTAARSRSFFLHYILFMIFKTVTSN